MTGPRQRSLGHPVSLTPASAAPKATGRVSQACGRGRTLKDYDFRNPSLHTRPDARAHPNDPSVKRQVISSRYRSPPNRPLELARIDNSGERRRVGMVAEISRLVAAKTEVIKQELK